LYRYNKEGVVLTDKVVASAGVEAEAAAAAAAPPAAAATATAAAPPPAPAPPPPLDPNGPSVRIVRRAIADSCSKYCDVLLQVAQDLPPAVLAGLKAKAVTSLDGHSQELFSGALAAAFGVDVTTSSEMGGWGSGVGSSEPEVVAAVRKSVTALLRKAAGGSGDRGAAEAREVARVVLASRTIRAHVEPLLTRLLSELDEEEEAAGEMM
jgi:hypothetical protein